MQTYTKTDGQFQGLPLFDWRAAVVHAPATRGGQHLTRRYRVDPAIADVMANLAGFVAEREAR